MNDASPSPTITTTTTTTTESAEATLARFIDSKPFMVAVQIFAIMGGIVGALFLYVANQAVNDLSALKTSVATLQLSITPQLSEIKTEIADMKNQSTLDRADLHRLQDRIMTGPQVVIAPSAHGGKER